MQVHTPRGKCLIDDYNEQSLALLIPGSRLNTRNSPSARPHCDRQPLKKSRIERNRENLTTQKFFTQIIFNMKISQSTVGPCSLLREAADPANFVRPFRLLCILIFVYGANLQTTKRAVQLSSLRMYYDST